jgi:hypothetical protein
MWKHAWVNNASQFQTRWEGLRVSNGEGTGFVAQGTRDWKNYRASAELTPLLGEAWGLAARVQGRERYYAVMFDKVDGGRVKLVRRNHDETILASHRFPWQYDQKYDVAVAISGNKIEAHVAGNQILAVIDTEGSTLTGGGVGLVVDTGSMATQAVHITPL